MSLRNCWTRSWMRRGLPSWWGIERIILWLKLYASEKPIWYCPVNLHSKRWTSARTRLTGKFWFQKFWGSSGIFNLLQIYDWDTSNFVSKHCISDHLKAVFCCEQVITMANYTIKRMPEFDVWLSGIKDGLTRIRLARRIDRLQLGLLGDVAPVGESEIRLGWWWARLAQPWL